MENVKLKTVCPHCDNKLLLEFNSWTHELSLETPDVLPYKDKKIVVDHYKKLRGYDKIKTWDSTHRARAFRYAKELLAACAAEPCPLDAARDAIGWTEDEARRRGLASDQWNLGTVVKWSADFLKAQFKRRAAVAAPKCRECTNPAVTGAKVCLDCSWCHLCDTAGRPSQKPALDMVYLPGKTERPICKACAETSK